MLIDVDERVRAEINLDAVFGALPTLVELVPDARDILSPMRSDTTLTLRAPAD